MFHGRRTHGFRSHHISIHVWWPQSFSYLCWSRSSYHALMLVNLTCALNLRHSRRNLSQTMILAESWLYFENWFWAKTSAVRLLNENADHHVFLTWAALVCGPHAGNECRRKKRSLLYSSSTLLILLLQKTAPVGLVLIKVCDVQAHLYICQLHPFCLPFQHAVFAPQNTGPKSFTQLPACFYAKLVHNTWLCIARSPPVHRYLCERQGIGTWILNTKHWHLRDTIE